MFETFVFDASGRRTLVHRGEDRARAAAAGEQHIQDPDLRGYGAVRFEVEPGEVAPSGEPAPEPAPKPTPRKRKGAS